MAYYENRDLSLKKGYRGDEVKELQDDIKALGYDIGTADGIFGSNTEKAVKAFQERNFVTGIVNPETASIIHAKAAENQNVIPVSLQNIPFIASPNFSSRKGRDITMVVIHFTANSSLESTVNWFENPAADASAHYIVGKDGNIVRMVKEEDKAWHAGKSQWAGEINCNNFSIGIELVNWGQLKKKADKFYCWPGSYSTEYSGAAPIEADGRFWEPYTDDQYNSLASLTRTIVQKHSIPLNRVVGHSDIAPDRKIDPGPHFDFQRLKNTLV